MKRDNHYLFNSIVRRIVLDNITIGVWAKDTNEAVDKVTEFLEDFPSPTEVSGVDYGYIDNRETLESTVIDLELKDKH